MANAIKPEVAATQQGGYWSRPADWADRITTTTNYVTSPETDHRNNERTFFRGFICDADGTVTVTLLDNSTTCVVDVLAGVEYAIMGTGLALTSGVTGIAVLF